MSKTSLLKNDKAIDKYIAEINRKEEYISELEKQNKNLATNLVDLKKEFRNYRKLVIEKDSIIQNYFNTLQSVYTSKVWKLYSLYVKLIKKQSLDSSISSNPKLDLIPIEDRLVGLTNKDFDDMQSYKLLDTLDYLPLFSIILPVTKKFNEKLFLEYSINSILKQIYSNWELIILVEEFNEDYFKEILDKYSILDARIKIRKVKNGLNIPQMKNRGLKHADGEYVTFIDGNDAIDKNVILKSASEINRNKEIQVVYFDEDYLDYNNGLIDIYYKSSFDKFHLWSTNYVGDFVIYKKDVLSKDPFIKDLEGLENWSLNLRVLSNINLEYISHIPEVLYHKRIFPNHDFTSEQKIYQEKGVEVISKYFNSMNIKSDLYKTNNAYINYKLKLSKNPLVSIIIPVRDNLKLLEDCIKSIEDKSLYKNYEIIIVDHLSQDEGLLAYLKKTRHKVIKYTKEFNFSALNNFAVHEAKGDYLLFLNNDTEIISPDWLETMLSYAQLEDVGAVGAKLFYLNNTVQHAGVYLYKDHPLHIFAKAHFLDKGYFNYLRISRKQLAVTGACLMISKSKFKEVGMFDEELPIEANDIDFCLKLIEKGYSNIVSMNTYLYHIESKTRKMYHNMDANMGEWKIFVDRWAKYLGADPYNRFYGKI